MTTIDRNNSAHPSSMARASGFTAALTAGLLACHAPAEDAGDVGNTPTAEELRERLPGEQDVAMVLASLEERGCAIEMRDSIVLSDPDTEHAPFIAGPTVCADSELMSYMVVLVAPDQSIRFAGGVLIARFNGEKDGVIAHNGELAWVEEFEWQRQATAAAFGPYAARVVQEEPGDLSSDRFDDPIATPYGACGDCVATCKDSWQMTESTCDGEYDLVDFLTLVPVTCAWHNTFGGEGTTEECFDSCGDCPSDDRCETDDDCFGWFSGCPSDDPAAGCPTCETHTYTGGGSVGVCSDSEGDPS